MGALMATCAILAILLILFMGIAGYLHEENKQIERENKTLRKLNGGLSDELAIVTYKHAQATKIIAALKKGTVTRA